MREKSKTLKTLAIVHGLMLSGSVVAGVMIIADKHIGNGLRTFGVCVAMSVISLLVHKIKTCISRANCIDEMVAELEKPEDISHF